MGDSWFVVDKDGLKALQSGKDKFFIIKELVQNAWDENIKECKVFLYYSKEKGVATIAVEDDSPEGFRNIAHAYTLFADTYKRRDVTKRGRFNLGEKQVIAICESAMVRTTKGTIIFDQDGRHDHKDKKGDKRKSGSIIELEVKMSPGEFDNVLSKTSQLLPPKGIIFTVNGGEVPYQKPYRTFEATLTTEIEKNGQMSRTERKTKVDVHETDGEAWLFEMGIPIIQIECDYSIDVQQKIPLGVDRESVIPSFMPDLYAEVLNHTFEDIEPEQSSQVWVRTGMSDNRVSDDAVREVIKKRYGDKVVVASPGDPNSIDDAISEGYNVVWGREMGKEEWDNIRRAEAIPSTKSLFGHGFVDSESVKPTKNMRMVEAYAKKIASRFMGIEIRVRFVKAQSTNRAQYGARTLTFVVNKLNGFFKNPVSAETTNLIIHELGHEYGNHTEMSYHRAITRIAGEMVMEALKNPDFFKVEVD